MNSYEADARAIRSPVKCTIPSDPRLRAAKFEVSFSQILEEALMARIEDLERAELGREPAPGPTIAENEGATHVSASRQDNPADPFRLSRSAFKLLSKDEQRTVARLIREGRVELADRRPLHQPRALRGGSRRERKE